MKTRDGILERWGKQKQGVDKVCPVPGRYLHLPVEVKKGRLR